MNKNDTSPRPTGDGPSGSCGCKISRNASRYDFGDLYRKLSDLWLGRGCDEHSLRELRDQINVRILRSALEDAGEETVVGEVESKYDVLTGDDYTAGEITEVENHLRSKGVDVERVRDDFVSHQSVANHFYKCLDKKKGKSSPSEGNDVRNIRSLEKMAKDRLEQMVEKHRNTGSVDLSEDYRIETDFYVVDEDGSRKRLTDLVSDV